MCAIYSIDINECTRGTHNCSSLNQVCLNLEPPVLFRCECEKGYELNEVGDTCVGKGYIFGVMAAIVTICLLEQILTSVNTKMPVLCHPFVSTSLDFLSASVLTVLKLITVGLVKVATLPASFKVIVGTEFSTFTCIHRY